MIRKIVKTAYLFWTNLIFYNDLSLLYLGMLFVCCI